MNICFLVDSTSFSGGNFVVYQHGLYCHRVMKWNVFIIITGGKSLNKNHVDIWEHEGWEVFTFITLEDAKNKLFDYTIATFWNTVHHLGAIQSKYYAYLVQGFEPDFYDKHEHEFIKLSSDTYATPMPMIAVSNPIKNYLNKYYNKKVWVVPNGTNKEIFSKTGKKKSPKISGLRLLVEGDINSKLKNVRRTIELCKQSDAEEVWGVFLNPPKEGMKTDKCFFNVRHSEISEIYRSCDIMVKLSFTESFSFPVVEFIHCGGIAITSDIACFREYISHGKNGYIVPLYNDKEAIQHINDLVKHRNKLTMMQKEAYKMVEKWVNWEESSRLFVYSLNDIIKNYKAFNNDDIKSYSQKLYEEYTTPREILKNKLKIAKKKALIQFNVLKTTEARANRLKIELNKLKKELIN